MRIDRISFIAVLVSMNVLVPVLSAAEGDCPDLLENEASCARRAACGNGQEGSLASMLRLGIVEFDPATGKLFSAASGNVRDYRTWQWYEAPSKNDRRAWCSAEGWAMAAHAAKPPARPPKAPAAVRCLDGSSGGIDYGKYPRCVTGTADVLRNALSALASAGFSGTSYPAATGEALLRQSGPSRQGASETAALNGGSGTAGGSEYAGSPTTTNAEASSESGPRSAGFAGVTSTGGGGHAASSSDAPAFGTRTGTSSSAASETAFSAATSESSGCGPCTGACNTMFWDAVDRKPINRACLQKCTGAPENTFGGGSQNWPPLCQAGAYLTDHDPKWFEGYFAAQRPGGRTGLGGTEMFAPLYMNPPVGAVLAVLKESQTRHPELAASARAWLRASWAVQTLAALHVPIRQAYVHTGDGTPELINSSLVDGLHVGQAGPRIRHPEYGPMSVNHRMLTMAVDARRTGKGRATRRFIGAGWRYMLEISGFRFNDRAVDLNQKAVPPELIGLTEADRAALQRLVATGGGVSEVLAMVGSFPAACPITFLRTTEGVATWYGSSTEDGRNCNGNKPPFFAVTLSKDGVARYLRVEFRIIGSAAGRVWREGNKVCAQATAKDCLDLPGGQVLYEVYFSKTGIRAVSGGGGPYPGPGPSPDPGPRPGPIGDRPDGGFRDRIFER